MQVVDPVDPGGAHPLPELRLTGLPAVVDALGQARRQLVAWAGRSGLNDEQVDDLGLAAYEAMANVVDHAYDGPGGLFDLYACRRDDMVTVSVTDHGRWKPPTGGAQSWRGRGLQIIERVSQEFELCQHPRGTTLAMRWALAGR